MLELLFLFIQICLNKISHWKFFQIFSSRKKDTKSSAEFLRLDDQNNSIKLDETTVSQYFQQSADNSNVAVSTLLVKCTHQGVFPFLFPFVYKNLKNF